MDNSRRRKRGPKMLALGTDVADGALPAGQPLEFTEWARDVHGPPPPSSRDAAVWRTEQPDSEAPCAVNESFQRRAINQSVAVLPMSNRSLVIASLGPCVIITVRC